MNTGQEQGAAPHSVSGSKRSDVRRNHQRLIDAGLEAFAELGTMVSLDEIARRAGMGIATLYRHFPNRQMLVRDVLAAARERADINFELARTAPAGLERLLLYSRLDCRSQAELVIFMFAGTEVTVGHTLSPARVFEGYLSSLIATAQATKAIESRANVIEIRHALIRLSRPLTRGERVVREQTESSIENYLRGLASTQHLRVGSLVAIN
jgi:AcrR family transcriptional regulator